MLKATAVALLIATASIVTTTATFAAETTWDGTWTGKTPRGKVSTFKISKGKVASWHFDGKRQPITASSVKPGKVTIKNSYGGSATLTPVKDGVASYFWRNGGDSLTQEVRRR